MGLERDSQSEELQSYSNVFLNDGLDTSPLALADGVTALADSNSQTETPTSPAQPKAAMATSTRRGTNWSAIDPYCFITALDNHNPWIAVSAPEALTLWNEAVRETNKALLQHKRESRNQGAFEAQWRKMVKDVREQKNLRLKATGANFDEDGLYTTLYNLVDLYNASSFKLAFLKPDAAASLSPLSQAERLQKQKRKQAVSAAREAGQAGQTLALQRLRH